jgi:hypothetical protein
MHQKVISRPSPSNRKRRINDGSVILAKLPSLKVTSNAIFTKRGAVHAKSTFWILAKGPATGRKDMLKIFEADL